MSFSSWFNEQMSGNKLVARGFFDLQRSGESCILQFWTQYMGDEPFWGGARYWFSQGAARIEMTVFPLMKPQHECAAEATLGWNRFVGWRQHKHTVLHCEHDRQSQPVASSNPLALQHLARAHGMLVMAQANGGEAGMVCSALTRRIQGLIVSGNRELAATMRTPY